MKTKFFFLAVVAFALSFTACNDNNDPTPPGNTIEGNINASSLTIWQYYSFAENKVVGSAEGNATNDAAWATRNDWDIAVRTRYIRTNSGKSTTSGKGGAFIFDSKNVDKGGNINVTTTFASVQDVSGVAVFSPDSIVTYSAMGGYVTTSQSKTVVVNLKKNDDGSSVMPAVYLKAPVYIFRTADGNSYYKVEFTQYKNENNVSGYVKFNMAQIYKN